MSNKEKFVPTTQPPFIKLEPKLVSKETAKLAEEVGLYTTTEANYILLAKDVPKDMETNDPEMEKLWKLIKNDQECDNLTYAGYDTQYTFYHCLSVPTLAQLQTWIREHRGVHIEVGRNASGYFWTMCKSYTGTDLGYSEYRGPNASGVWDTYEEALDDGLFVQLSFDLPEDMSQIKHWGNYATRATVEAI